MARFTRRLLVGMHRWLGLALGFFLALLGLTGAVLVFAEEIDRALNPELYFVTNAANGAPRPLSEIIAAGRVAASPGWSDFAVTIPKASGQTYIFGFWYGTPTPEPEGAVSLNIAVDPTSATATGRRVFYHAWNPLRHCFVGFFFKLHYALFLLDTGTFVVGVIGVLLLLSVLAGVYLWWPRRGKWLKALTIKRNASRERFVYDLHQLTGLYLLPVMLAVLVSGLYFNLPDEFKWVVERFSPVAREIPLSSPPSAGAGMVDLDRALHSIRGGLSGGRLSSVGVPSRPGAPITACYADVAALAPYIVDTRCLSLDYYTGAILRVDDAEHGSAADTFMRWQWPLHSGKAFDWPGRILVLILGLACPLIFATGVIRWLHKARARHRVEARQHITVSR